MKLRKFLPVFIIFFLAVGVIGTVHAETSYNAAEDTYASTFDSLGGNHGTDGSVTIQITNGSVQDNLGLWLFNNSQYNNRLFTSLYFGYYVNTTCGNPSCVKGIVYITNNTWDENIVNGTNRPSITPNYFVAQTHPSVGGVNTSANILATNLGGESYLIHSLYRDSYTTLAAGGNLNDGGAFGSPVQTSVFSKEFGTPAFLSMNQTDYLTFLVQATDLSSVLYVDFATQTASTTAPPYYDFSYDPSTGVITPHLANIAFFTSTTNNSNTLGTIPCALAAPFSSSPVSQLNDPHGTYDTFCFDLSPTHGGKSFFGAIKIINNTNVRGGSNPEFDFYAAEYSPLFTQFSNFVNNPNPAQAGRNLTITWDTSTPLTTVLRYQIYNPVTNSTGGINTIFGDQNFTLSHTVTIDASSLFAGGITLSYFAVGTNSQNVSYASGTTSLLVSDFVQSYSDITSGIMITVENNFGNPLIGLGAATCSLDGIFSTSNYENGYNQTCYYNGFGLGLHNVTVGATGYQTQNFTINVLQEPFFITVKLQPASTCLIATHATSADGNQTALQNVRNAINQGLFSAYNVTGYYVQFNPSECLTYNVNGTPICGTGTVPFGAWDGFVCLDNYFPQGIPVNGTSPFNNPTGNQTSTFGQGAATSFQVLGLSAEQTLNFMAMLITLIVVLAAGIITKEGLITTVVFIIMQGLFTLINWLPWWFLLIEAVIAVTLIAKFFRTTMTPQ